ncbi:MAG: HDIG domain-containing metalloprotein [Limnochordia bacterium]|jgi:putative nucleotidyltransferase with HDIG domain
MSRAEALALVRKYIDNKNLLKHMLATEAIMGRLAQHFQVDANLWKIAGLVHDIDYAQTQDKPEEHGLISAQILREHGFDEDIVHAVLAHACQAPRDSLLDKALFASDPLTGLIVAAALIHPDKKLASIDTDFLLNRFREKSFARGANREQIASCEDFDLALDEFMALGLEAMRGISKELGL